MPTEAAMRGHPRSQRGANLGSEAPGMGGLSDPARARAPQVGATTSRHLASFVGKDTQSAGNSTIRHFP